MIIVDRLAKWYPTRFGKKWVLRDLSLTIPYGCNVAILGRNGAGKSTLLRLVGGIERPSAGSVRIDGTMSWPLGLTGGHQGSMTGRDNVQFVARIHGCGPVERARIVDFVCEFSELGRDFELPVKSYSSGMRSRLAFAISIAFRFDWYLIDELRSVGDPAFKRKSAQAIAELKGRSSFIMVTHETRGLAREVDLVVVIHDGIATVYPDVQRGIAAYHAGAV